MAAVLEPTPAQRCSRPIHGNANLLAVAGVISGLARVVVDLGPVRDHGSHMTSIVSTRTERVAVFGVAALAAETLPVELLPILAMGFADGQAETDS